MTGLKVETINREASDKTKGFRLQKLRAIKLMLETIESEDKAIFYTAIEDVEDVSHTKVSGDDSGKYYEEDKNYAEGHKFTIFSPPVKNTLVSFFDIYVGTWRSSDEVRLGFYTTAAIGKEKKQFTIDGKEVDAPSEPILQCLSSGGELSDEIVQMVKYVVLDEYNNQYLSKAVKGNLSTLEGITLEDFRKFLKKIIWYFESEDEKQLKDTIIHLIKESKWHNHRIANKEEAVFSILMEMLDERQGEASLAKRVVHASDVRLVFKQAESEENDLVMDPTWEELKKIEQEITDKRNLKEKVVSVCPKYADKKMKHLARLACRSKTEQSSNNRTFLSLKYRIYEACSEYFFRNGRLITNESEVDKAFEELKTLSEKHINELKKDYTYTVSNTQAIEGIIMDLFDSCFVSFDEVANDK